MVLFPYDRFIIRVNILILWIRDLFFDRRSSIKEKS